jgi:peptidyl-Asp metalloendopeptidase
MGGSAEMLALIDQMVSEMNTANENSRLSFEWRLAAAEEVDYQETGDLWDDLNNLQTPGNGVIDEIHARRDAVKADLVTMLVTEGSNNLCGLAFQLSGPDPWFESWAFSVAALEYAGNASCNQFNLAHELGHTLGNVHDRQHTSLAGAYPYSHGYQWAQEPPGFRDIMAYDCPGGCPRINHWANPEVNYMGQPTGIDYEDDPEDSADLVRSMDNIRSIAANFRADCEVDPVSTDTPEPIETADPTATVTLTPSATKVASPTPSATATTMTGPTIIPPGNQRIYLPAIR